MDEEDVRDLIGLIIRFLVAMLLDVFTDYCKEQAGLDPKATKNEHVALYCASVFNEVAHMCFQYAMIRVIVALLVDRIRIALPDCLDKLVVGSIALLISFSFLVYFRCFVVGG